MLPTVAEKLAPQLARMVYAHGLLAPKDAIAFGSERTVSVAHDRHGAVTIRVKMLAVFAASCGDLVH